MVLSMCVLLSQFLAFFAENALVNFFLIDRNQVNDFSEKKKFFYTFVFEIDSKK